MAVTGETGGRIDRVDEWVAGFPGYVKLEVISGMLALFVKTVRTTVRPPYSWRRDFVEQGSLGIRRSFVPLMITNAFFSFGLVLTNVAGVLDSLGSSDRFGFAMSGAWPREVAFWISMMIFVGVVGSSVTADLGARKIREELDAITVLGVDPVKALVVPRVVALTVLAPVLASMNLFMGIAFGAAGNATIGIPFSVFLDTFTSGQTAADLFSFLFRATLVGLVGGIVCTYKGLHAKGGTEGVGQAVKETVIVTFFALWAINTVWNIVFLSLFPYVSVPRG